MVDFSVNDGYFKIEKNSTFSKAIIKELGLSKEESKQMASAWGKIFEIAKREKMGNLDLVKVGQEFKFSDAAWKEIKDIVDKEIKKANGIVINENTPIDEEQKVSGPKKRQSWKNLKQIQDEINQLPTNKERVIEYNKKFSKDRKNYVIVDKETCTATVYTCRGKVVKQFEVILGKEKGDKILRNVGPKEKRQNFTTPGIYTANYKATGKDSYRRLYNDRILTLSNDALRERGVGSGETGVALHQIPNGNTRRVKALKEEGVSTENNRMSDGCVNFLPEEFDEMMKHIDGVGTKVYILPEDDNNFMSVKNGKLQFSQKNYTGDVPTTTTKNNAIRDIEIKSKEEIREEGQDMAKALCDYKTDLCKDLKIDNDTYNELAILALGIAEQETKFGHPLSGLKKFKPYYLKENCQGLVNFMKSFKNNKSYNSRGLTQMKIKTYTDENVKKLFKKYEITSDKLGEGEASAIATMVVLGSILKNELPALKSKMEQQGVTKAEALLYCWQNKKSEIRNGTATPDKNIYIRNVKEYIEKYEVTQFV